MISDIISQAVVDLDHYLNDPNFDGIYKGELRTRIIRLRDEAEYIRAVLDTHPCDTPPSEAVLRDPIAAERREIPMSDDLFEFLAAQKGERAATPAKSAPKPVQPQGALPTGTEESGSMSDDLFEFLAAQDAAGPATPATPVLKSAAEVRAIIEKIKRRTRNAPTARPF